MPWRDTAWADPAAGSFIAKLHPNARHLCDADEALRWMGESMTPNEADRWILAGITDPREAGELDDIGVTPEMLTTETPWPGHRLPVPVFELYTGGLIAREDIADVASRAAVDRAISSEKLELELMRSGLAEVA